jgi:hypothetical protein
LQDDLRSINVEISAFIACLQALPTNNTTAASCLESSLLALRDRKPSIMALFSSNELNGASQVYGNIISLLGRAFVFRPEVQLFVLFLFVTASIGVGALLLTAPSNKPGQQSQDGSAAAFHDQEDGTDPSVGRRLPPYYAPPITLEAFLKAAKDGADLPFIHGRDKTAEKLGISLAEAKRLVGRLLANGMIAFEGKQLKLVSDVVIGTQ